MRIVKPDTRITAKRGRLAKSAARGIANGDQADELLLAKYRRSRAVSLRNALIERYRKTVEEMARGLSMRLPRSVDVQDLVHAGMWGLIQSVENFREERGDCFASSRGRFFWRK